MGPIHPVWGHVLVSFWFDREVESPHAFIMKLKFWGRCPGSLWGFCQGHNKWKKCNFSKSKSVLPKMLARSGLVGKTSSWPYLEPSEAIFSMDRKSLKQCWNFAYFLGGGSHFPSWGAPIVFLLATPIKWCNLRMHPRSSSCSRRVRMPLLWLRS